MVGKKRNRLSIPRRQFDLSPSARYARRPSISTRSNESDAGRSVTCKATVAFPPPTVATSRTRRYCRGAAGAAAAAIGVVVVVVVVVVAAGLILKGICRSFTQCKGHARFCPGGSPAARRQRARRSPKTGRATHRQQTRQTATPESNTPESNRHRNIGWHRIAQAKIQTARTGKSNSGGRGSHKASLPPRAPGPAPQPRW